MISNELVAELKEQCALWRDGLLPDSMFEVFVLEALSNVDSAAYEVEEVLDTGAIVLLLEHGAQQIQNEFTGGMRMISNGHEIDISHLAAQYRRIFEQWVRRGWIVSVNGSFIRQQ